MATAADLRVGIADLSVIAASDLDALWRAVDDAMSARTALEDVLPALVATYGSAAASLAADWYDEYRADINVSGRFTAIPADASDTGADILARWGIGPLFGAEPDWARARTLIEGGLQLRIANAARGTIAGSSIADPQALGWQRLGGGGCGFCQMLVARGAVYTEKTAKFGAHDHCRCQAVPAFGDRPLLVDPYKKTTRNVSDADRARVRDWISANT